MPAVLRSVGPGLRERGRALLDRMWGARDRLIASAAFQRRAVSFAPTRPIADAQARALFDLCAGFVYSQVLVACVRLDLFRLLAAGPKSVAEIARACDLPEASAERLALAAASVRLLAPRGDRRYGLGMLGAALADDSGIAAMIAHHAMLYRDLEDPVALLRGERGGTELARYWPYAGADDPQALESAAVGPYSALMAASQSFVARDVLDAYPFARHRVLLDVGGGEGAFLAAAGERFPGLGLMLFDLPPVIARARSRAEPAIARAAMHPGSFLTDSLPPGADLVTLVRVCHDHDDATVAALFRAVFAALPAGGTLLVAEPFAGVRGAERVGDAYFGMYLLAMGQGRARRPEELAAMLRRAGFESITPHVTRRPMLVGAVSARRPANV